MKRATFSVTVLLFLGALGISAQQFENESEYYPKTLQIHRIYRHSNGYRIDYVKQDYSLGVFWAPIDWFRGGSGSIGAIAYGVGGAYPYASFFFKEGEIDYFRLYLIEDTAHESWGSLDPQTDYSEEFPSPDSKPQIIL